MDIIRQYEYLVVNRITVNSYGFLRMGVASDSVLTLPKTFIGRSVPDGCLWMGPPWLNLGLS